MPKINTMKLFDLLKDKSIKNERAGDFPEIVFEIDKVSKNFYNWLKDLEVEQCIKKILWEGILNEYGTFGSKSGGTREYSRKKISGGKEDFNYNQQFTKGKLLSIDFGTSNIDRELALTHTGIVLADYTGMVIVVPITSQTSLDLNKLSPDIKGDIIPILKKDYPQIENDSYILMHQLRCISKNRITKTGIIGSISNTKILEEIELKFTKICAFDYFMLQRRKIEDLEEQIANLKKVLT